MVNDQTDRRFLKRSFGLSAGLHIVLLPAILAFFWHSAWGTDIMLGPTFAKRETMSISFMHIEHQRAPARPKPVAAPRGPIAPAPPQRISEIATPHRIRDAVPQHAKGGGATTRPVPVIAPLHLKSDVAYTPVEVANPTATSQAGTATAAPEVQPTETPSPVPTTVSEDKSARGMDVPPGAWGQSFEHPIVADDAAVTDLRSRFPENWHATIEIGDDGRPIHVLVPGDVPDEVRAAIERELMALRYIPAECNGLRCAGKLEI